MYALYILFTKATKKFFIVLEIAWFEIECIVPSGYLKNFLKDYRKLMKNMEC